MQGQKEMLDKFESVNQTNKEGNPAGGYAKGIGIDIRWQDGPLGQGENRKEPNGASVETVIAIAIDRIKFYNESKFKCHENSVAITKLEEALMWLDYRTKNREQQGVEGTYKA